MSVHACIFVYVCFGVSFCCLFVGFFSCCQTGDVCQWVKLPLTILFHLKLYNHDFCYADDRYKMLLET